MTPLSLWGRVGMPHAQPRATGRVRATPISVLYECFLYECLYECAFGYLGIPTTISREKLQLCECLIYVFMITCAIGAHVTRALGYRRVFRYLRTHTFAHIPDFPLTAIWNLRLV